jgi:hypothetical protein
VGLLLTRALVCRYRDEVPFGCFGGTTRDRYLYGIYTTTDPHGPHGHGTDYSGQEFHGTRALYVSLLSRTLPSSGLLVLQEMEPPEVLTAHIRCVNYKTHDQFKD